MDAEGRIVPKFLNVYELNYELLIRRIRTTKPLEDKRRILEHELYKEITRPASFSTKHLSFEADKTEITSTLESVTTLILEFDSGTADDSLYHRIVSRLNHVRERILRTPIASQPELKEAQKNTRDEFYATCLTLEADLRDRVIVSTPVSTTVSSPFRRYFSSFADPTSNPETHNARSVPVYKWNVSFDGHTNLSSFLEKVDDLKVARGVSDDELFRSAYDLFAEPALTWYRSVRASVATWGELVDLLKKTFLPTEYDEMILENLKSRFQGKNEPVALFVADMSNLFSRLSQVPDKKDQLKLIRKNVLPSYVTALALQKIDTADELISLCRQIEEANQANERRPKAASIPVQLAELSAPSTSRNTSEPSPIPNAIATSKVCWNCNKQGHLYSQCPEKRRAIFCYRCGLGGHTVSDCPACKKN